MTSTKSHTGATPVATRRALLERVGELKPALERRLRVRLPEDLRTDLQSVTMYQLEALRLLERDGLRMRELARELDISEPAATALADRLVRGGFVERRAEPTDRRIVRLELSPMGLRLMSRWGAVRRQTMTAAFEVLSDRQLTALIDIMETLAAGNPSAVRAALGEERSA
jgi:DNA-binding MarR family transcriptional regulator